MVDGKLDQLLCLMRFSPARSSLSSSGSQIYSAQNSDLGADFGVELNERDTLAPFQLQPEPQ